jgi:hypothetical protein
MAENEQTVGDPMAYFLFGMDVARHVDKDQSDESGHGKTLMTLIAVANGEITLTESDAEHLQNLPPLLKSVADRVPNVLQEYRERERRLAQAILEYFRPPDEDNQESQS